MVIPSIAAGSGRTRTRASTAELGTRFSRWLAPTFSEVARLTPQKPSLLVNGNDEFDTTLDMFTRRLRGAWRVAVLRRSLICGLAAGCIVALAVEWASGAHWIGPLVAILTTLALAVWTLGDAPGKDASARFLDHQLALREQLSTALELATVPSVRPVSSLAAAVQRRAASIARTASKDWSIRVMTSGKEWGVAVALIVGIGLIVSIPQGMRTQAGISPGPAAGGNVPNATAPVLPSGPIGAGTLAVQVAVVSVPSAGATSSTKAGAVVLPKPHGAVLHSGTVGKPSSPGANPAAPSQKGSAAAKAAAAATATSAQHLVPLIQGSRGFLPTSPSSKGQSNGTFTGAPTKSSNSTAPGNSPAGVAGASSPKGTSSGSGAGGKGSTAKSAAGGSKGSGTGTAGKQGAGAGQAGTCALVYACAKVNPSTLTAPGLITGKGQFVGKGGAGGQTAGHAQGASLGSSKTKTPSSARNSKQLNISSAYGSSKASGKPAQQVQGHNGAGTSQQTTVTPGAESGQTVDYVPPDANIEQPSEAAIVGHYFVASAAS